MITPSTLQTIVGDEGDEDVAPGPRYKHLNLHAALEYIAHLARECPAGFMVLIILLLSYEITMTFCNITSATCT